MSRVFIKNIPDSIDEPKLKKHFEVIGEVTDAKIQRKKYSTYLIIKRSGKSRKIGFIGFKSEELAQKAIKHFNKTFLLSSMIEVQSAKGVKILKDGENTLEMDKSDAIKDRDLLLSEARLFIRNITYSCTEDDLRKKFEKYGELLEVHVPKDKEEKSKGYAFIKYRNPESSILALSELDGKIFQGRMLHIIPGKVKDVEGEVEDTERYKFKKELTKKAESMKDKSWNSMYLRSDTILDALSERYNLNKRDILNPEANNLAVRVALGETELIAETKQFLISQGVNMEALEKSSAGNIISRSSTLLIVKNLAYQTTEPELRKLFSNFGSIIRLLLPNTKALALVEYKLSSEAERALKSLSYTKFHEIPIYIEYAPDGLITEIKERETEAIIDAAEEVTATLYIKNINFKTTEESLKEHFNKVK